MLRLHSHSISTNRGSEKNIIPTFAALRRIFWALGLSVAAASPVGATDAYRPACDGVIKNECVAHLFPDDEQRKARNCFPERYLELWDTRVRAETPFRKHTHDAGYHSVPRAECGVPADFLEPLGELFACLIPGHCTSQRPFLGVALEGGGSKSPPFALGVLAGLADSGLLGKADVIASVSGGSYAAHFYFSRLLDAHERPDGNPSLERAAWFADCIPTAYARRFREDVQPTTEDCPAWPSALRLCQYAEDLDGRMCSNTGEHAEAPFQSHVRKYQDLVYPAGNWRRSGEDASDWWFSVLNVGRLLVEHALTLIPHHLAHSVFDWPINFSPSREAYRAGIERAFGHNPASWAEAVAAGPNDSEERMRVRKAHTFLTLAEIYKPENYAAADKCGASHHCRPPLWIVGTASSTGRAPLGWLFAPPRDALRTQFELTPFSIGSGTLGYLKQSIDMPLRDITGASAAFLDDEEKVIATQPSRLLAGAGLHLINADWSSELDNYNAGDSKRLIHALTPWPFYMAPLFSGRDSPYIHLSDGGNTDNLALLALLRRGVRNIVVSASTDDRSGEFPSLCQAKNQLELDGTYALLMPELEDFDSVCNQALTDQESMAWSEERVRQLFCTRLGLDDASPDCHARFAQRSATGLGYSLWDWPVPVLQGCVIRSASPDAPLTCEEARRGGRFLSKLLVIKPAVNLGRFAAQTTGSERSAQVRFCGCNPGGDDNDAYSLKIASCPSRSSARFVRRDVTDEEQTMDIPCQSLAFLANNRCTPDSYPDFPQHNFIFMTLNSSHTLFAAYYDLARRYAGLIEERTNQDGETQIFATGEACAGRPCAIPLRTYRFSDFRAGAGTLNEGRAGCLSPEG